MNGWEPLVRARTNARPRGWPGGGHVPYGFLTQRLRLGIPARAASACLPACLSLSLSLTISLYLSLSLFLSIYISLSLSLCLSVSLPYVSCLSLSVSVKKGPKIIYLRKEKQGHS